MTRILWTLIAGSALLLAACGSSAPGGLSGSWTATSIDGQATVAGSEPTISFGSDGRITGSTGCNTYSGTFILSGGNVTMSQLAMTQKACTDEAVSAQESAFNTALTGATSWSIGSDGNLTLKGAGDIVAKPGVTAT